jgi:rhamnogalacturonyl hydrolase YesR
MLGLTRTWATLAASSFEKLEGMDALRVEAQRMADEVLRRRQPTGLWTCFLDRSETGIDSSGSAGIAAAMALGVKKGLLAQEYLPAAHKAEQALLSYLTPDGILTGVAQHNAGGEALQSGGYRVLSQMGMGLLAQLHTALDGAPA